MREASLTKNQTFSELQISISRIPNYNSPLMLPQAADSLAGRTTVRIRLHDSLHSAVITLTPSVTASANTH
jgi:hypothetical protein